ncbi:MAG: hypothetical protein IKJ99_04320 [Oscillospiraceae bacterium]|nr:hypothetical protein [Oscillospiraceae bacterium]
MARILRIIATLFSCGSCAAMIYFSSRNNADAVYTCLILCIVSFFVNMIITARENAKKLEALQKEQETKQTGLENQTE